MPDVLLFAHFSILASKVTAFLSVKTPLKYPEYCDGYCVRYFLHVQYSPVLLRVFWPSDHTEEKEFTYLIIKFSYFLCNVR